MKFSDKVILITGAGSGICAETAKRFARLNASLVLVDMNNEGLRQVGRECQNETTVEPLLIQADLTKDKGISDVVTKTIERFNRLDVLINGAGVLDIISFQDSTMQHFDRLHSINIRALYHLTLLCTPHLIASKGVIVNISSCVTKEVVPLTVAYSLTKVAVDHLTKSLAVELGPKGVRVNAVNPGITNTPLYDFLGSKRAEVLSEAPQKIPLGYNAEPSQIAKSIVFLASDDASYITGAIMRVDGGIGL